MISSRMFSYLLHINIFNKTIVINIFLLFNVFIFLIHSNIFKHTLTVNKMLEKNEFLVNFEYNFQHPVHVKEM